MRILLALVGALVALCVHVCPAFASDIDPELEATPALADDLFTVAEALPPPWAEVELSDARVDRLRRLAEAVAHAAEVTPWAGTRAELAALLLAKAWWESRLSARVHRSGARRDHGGYAISLWSLHSWRLVPYAEWKTLGGLEGTERSALAAARVLAWARERCGAKRADWAEATIAMYATGKRCRWSGAGARAWTYRSILKKLTARSSASWTPLPANMRLAM